MFQRYVYKYLVVCYLILIIVLNTVADISLDYYFGNEEPLRSTNDLRNCKTLDMLSYCYQKCGPQHACLLGQCFCIKLDTTSEDNQASSEETSPESTESDSYEDEEDVEVTPSRLESNSYYEELSARPILRHHIAHFCPNLRIARICIRKCLKVGKPAFCGKDHRCYCGHKYDFPGKDPKLKPSEIQAQFRDLYEKYFGPKHKKHKMASGLGPKVVKIH